MRCRQKVPLTHPIAAKSVSIYADSWEIELRSAKLIPITLPNNSEPEPDIAIVRNSSTLYRDRHPYPEDIFWLVEIANSTLAKDLGMKRDLYADAGIAEYWVINLQALVLVVFRNLTTTGYESTTSFTTGTISPLAFPDLEIDIQQLLT